MPSNLIQWIGAGVLLVFIIGAPLFVATAGVRQFVKWRQDQKAPILVPQAKAIRSRFHNH